MTGEALPACYACRFDAGVWARVGIAVAKGGRMSASGLGPWDGNPVIVLDDEQAAALLKESVTDRARSLRIID